MFKRDMYMYWCNSWIQDKDYRVDSQLWPSAKKWSVPKIFSHSWCGKASLINLALAFFWRTHWPTLANLLFRSMLNINLLISFFRTMEFLKKMDLREISPTVSCPFHPALVLLCLIRIAASGGCWYAPSLLFWKELLAFLVCVIKQSV